MSGSMDDFGIDVVGLQLAPGERTIPPTVLALIRQSKVRHPPHTQRPTPHPARLCCVCRHCGPDLRTPDPGPLYCLLPAALGLLHAYGFPGPHACTWVATGSLGLVHAYGSLPAALGLVHAYGGGPAALGLVHAYGPLPALPQGALLLYTVTCLTPDPSHMPKDRCPGPRACIWVTTRCPGPRACIWVTACCPGPRA